MRSLDEIDESADAALPGLERIIPPENHPITAEMIDRDALYILRKLRDAGFAGYLVGGGVRDLYLGKTPKDFDISTDARPGQLRKLFPNSNTIGRRFRLVQIFFRGGKTIEISTLRSLSEHDLDGPEAVLAPNNTFGTLSEDARRRDLTINSLFFEIETSTIIDYVNGSQDLDQGIIRIVGEPAKRISHDPVRMLRAIRHAARINFTIEEQTWKALCSNSDKLSLCPPSRLRDEFLKDLYSGAAAAWLELAVDSGLLFALFPFYRKILAGNGPAAAPSRTLLSGICQTIDRINSLSLELKIHRQPDFVLLGLFLIPWVEARFQLISQFRKGAPLFQLAKQIREEIDQTIGIQLNLRRSLRQEMVSLLINLSQLIHNKQQNSWPKWLKRKSYFKKSLLFYHFYMAAGTGTSIDHLFAGEPVMPPAAEEINTFNKEPLPPRSRPAFAQKSKGGIFGFKK
ncbi:polya polymerase [Desulfocastanea catecholica]